MLAITYLMDKVIRVLGKMYLTFSSWIGQFDYSKEPKKGTNLAYPTC